MAEVLNSVLRVFYHNKKNTFFIVDGVKSRFFILVYKNLPDLSSPPAHSRSFSLNSH